MHINPQIIIQEAHTKWFEQNLLRSQDCKDYLSKRSLSDETIKFFKIGYSYNPNSSLYNFLKKNTKIAKLSNKNKKQADPNSPFAVLEKLL